MIDLSNASEILIRDVKKAYFKLSVSNNGKVAQWDLNADDYMEGGKLSTGNIISDMILFVNAKMVELSNIIGVQKLDLKDITNFNYMDFTNKYKDEIIFHDLTYTNDFEKLYGVGPKFFWSAMFLKYSELQGVINKNAPAGDMFTVKDPTITISMVTAVDILLKVFLYSTSQSYRDKITANACFNIVWNRVGKFEGSAYRSTIYIYNKFIDDYTLFTTSRSFISRYIYPLSSSNVTNSSRKFELTSRLDDINILSSSLDTNLTTDATVITSIMQPISSQDAGRSCKEIDIISAYKRVPNDCLISCSLRIRYEDKNLDEGTNERINEELINLFYDVEYTSIPYVYSLYHSAINSPIMKYENIVFDKEVSEMVENNMVKLELSYSTYTTAGGTRHYDYNLLKDKKITPTKRRDTLYDVCSILMDNVSIDKNKAFLKLDVDFKRFYGHTK